MKFVPPHHKAFNPSPARASYRRAMAGAGSFLLSPVPSGIWSEHLSSSAAATKLCTKYLTEEELAAGFIWLSLCLYHVKVSGETTTQ